MKCVVGAAFGVVSPGLALAAVLSIGSGDGSLSVTANPFGDSHRAIYNPVGAAGGADFFFESQISISSSAGFRSLHEYARGAAPVSAVTVSQTATRLVTAFTIRDYGFTLTQRVSQTMLAGDVVGAVFTQRLDVTNLADHERSLSLRRYLDVDVPYDSSFGDRAGVTTIGGATVPFAVDSALGVGAEAAFVGVTATGGADKRRGRYEVSACCGRDDDPARLSETVFADADGDGFSDAAFDVALVLQNDFRLGAGAAATYETKTIFGSVGPVTPGGGESLPLLPTSIGADGAFSFDISPDAIAEGRTIWIDPEIATGYVYRVTGASFASVTAPSLAAVADADGYVLKSAEGAMSLAPGQTHVFDTPLRWFTIRGIDPALRLDPTGVTAFATGVALVAPTGGAITVTQKPIIVRTPDPTTVVPAPAAGPLLLGALALLAWRRRSAWR